MSIADANDGVSKAVLPDGPDLLPQEEDTESLEDAGDFRRKIHLGRRPLREI